MHKLGFCILTVIEMTYFLLVCNLYEIKYYHILILDIRYLKVAQQSLRMGRVQNLMFILDRVGLDRIKKIGPTYVQL